MVSYSPYHQLDDLAKATQPTTRSTLTQWMRDRIIRYNRSSSDVNLDPSELKGKIYTATSLKWRDNDQIEQTGNAPAYFGGVWSLATCKHHMRSRTTFRSWFSQHSDGLFLPTKPLFICTVAEMATHDQTNGRNAVASLAMVTHGFETVEAYAHFLQKRCSEKAFTSRRTRLDDSEDVDEIKRHARKAGDCHVDSHGRAGPPSSAHQHASQTGETCRCGDVRCSGESTDTTDGDPAETDRPIYERDLDTDHIKCLSLPGYWTTWKAPAFVAKPPTTDRIGVAANGYNMHSFAAVEQFLHERDT